jgi:hypothetical protein
MAVDDASESEESDEEVRRWFTLSRALLTFVVGGGVLHAWVS